MRKMLTVVTVAKEYLRVEGPKVDSTTTTIRL